MREQPMLSTSPGPFMSRYHPNSGLCEQGGKKEIGRYRNFCHTCVLDANNESLQMMLFVFYSYRDVEKVFEDTLDKASNFDMYIDELVPEYDRITC